MRLSPSSAVCAGQAAVRVRSVRPSLRNEIKKMGKWMGKARALGSCGPRIPGREKREAPSLG